MKLKKGNDIFFDYAGSTPLDKNVFKKMSFYEKDFFANPSAIYSKGILVRDVIDFSREKIAKLINAHFNEIIFTSSGTESNAMAILGIVKNYELKIQSQKLEKIIPHIITSKIEHPSVLENCKMLESTGAAEVAYINVDKNGIIDLEEFRKSLKDNTILVSVMYANNEIGTIQPIQEIAKIIRHFRKEKSIVYPLFHTDACQAINYLYTDNIEKLGVDLLSFNSSKIYGPKGVGVLYKKRSVNLSPIYMGGGQEFGLRSGTESVPLIYGIAMALQITNQIKNKEVSRLTEIRNYAILKLLSLPIYSKYKIILNGDKKERLPNNINISITGISSELLVVELSERGIYVSEKSACHSMDDNISYVIKAIRKVCKRNKDEIDGSLRISLGRNTIKKDIDIFIKELSKILLKYKDWK